MRLRAFAPLLVFLVAFAGEPAAAADQAGKPVTTAATAAPAPAAATSAPERKRVCQRETTVGSSIVHTVCRDQETLGETAPGLERLRDATSSTVPGHN